MKDDIFGQPTSLTQQSSVDDWNAAMLGFLAHAAVTPKHLIAALDAEPGFALGHATKGMFYMLLGRRELLTTVEDALSKARNIVAEGHSDLRERTFVDALSVWVDGSPSGAATILDTYLAAHPTDALAMKLVQAILFVLGDPKGMRTSVERIMPSYSTSHAAHGYLLGCHAFALEETGDYVRAEIAGRQALWTAPDDAWGLHAVAHVHDMTGNARGGLAWLEGKENAWAHCNNFRYHVWWHKALMHLDIGEIDHVMALYDSEIRADRTDDYRDISNATSLLMRLELEGINVGNRWEELADLCAARTEDGSLIFADMHYLLALTGDRREMETAEMIRRIKRDGMTGGSDSNIRMANPGIAAAEGLHAFSEANYNAAFANLCAARPGMQLAGGSHAQRDIFERITIDAGLRAGRLDEAEKLLNERRALRGGNDDGYAAARRAMIASGSDTDAASTHRLPAE